MSPLDTGLVRGRTYRFKTRALNQIGYSEFSLPSYIAFGDVPSAPNAPVLVESGKTHITLRWQAPAVSELTVTGYTLSVDDGYNGPFKAVFIGTNRPDINSYQVGDLATGRPYRFFVQAMSQNGISPASPIATYYACTGPSGQEMPTYVSSSTQSIRIAWKAPSEDGGCRIQGYRLFMSDGITDLIEREITTLSNVDPSIKGHIIDMSSDGVTGRIYKIKMRSQNAMGFTDSKALAVALASLPSKPSTSPVPIA